MAESALKVGQQVKLVGKDVVGTVAFVGTTKFAAGKWVGVVLDDPCGRNNGTVEGIAYFKCEERCGLFVRQTQLETVGGDGNRTPRPLATTPTSATTPAAPRSSGGKRRIEPTRLPIAGGGGLRRTPSSGSGWGQSDTDLTRSTSSLRTAATPGSKETSPKGPDTPQNARMTASFVETNFVESRSPAALPSTRQEERLNLQELENLRTEVRDLTEKLETLKIKRAQDKEKLKEGEKLRLQVEQLTEFKTRIMESQAQLQRELATAKGEAREAAESRNQTVEDTQDLADTVEMLTLDKEMAEERAETLQLELDQAREQIEELTVDLEILKEAGGGMTMPTGGVTPDGEEVGGATLLQVKQLEQQNQRLHDTLVKMRDVAAHEKHEMQKLSKEMETRKTELTTISRTKEQLDQQLQEKSAQIADLQEQVDAALGAEDMVETLTERNLELEEQVIELEEQVRDLEDINYTNDLLVEGAKEQELELREDIDLTAAKLRETEREREALGAVIVDRDATIAKFRELVQTLTDQNADLRGQLTKATNRPVGTPSEVIDFKKLFSETKAHSAAIDLELRQLELQQAQDHVAYLKQYLPDNFMTRGGDQDAVNLLLLLPRLVWKAEVVMGGVAKFPLPETFDRATVLRSHAVDQYAFACRLRHLLHSLQSCVHQFQHAVNRGSVEQFLALGGLYPEMAAHERALDQYVEMLRKDQLDENIGLELLEKVVSSVQQLQATHLPSARLEQPLLLGDLSRAVAAAADAATTDAARIVAIMPSGSDQQESAQFCSGVKSSCSDLLNSVKRIRRRLPQDGSAGPITFPGEVQQELLAMVPSMSRVAATLRQVARSAVQQAGLAPESSEGVPCDKVQELLHQATDLTYGSDDQGPETVKAALHAACHQLDAIASSLEKGEYDYDGTPSQDTNDTPPIVQRAQNIKAELKDSEHIKYKLESKDQDLRDLRLLMKQKNEELSEMVVRRDLAEKKLVTATKDADATIEKLQRKVDDTVMLLKRKEKEYEETMDHLQSDIESLESEKGELREKLQAIKKRSLYDSMDEKTALTALSSAAVSSSPGSAAPVAPSAGAVHDSPALVQQIKDLRTALRCSTAAAALSTRSSMRDQLASLPPIPVCRVSSDEEKRDFGKDEGAGEVEANKRRADTLNALAQQTLSLKKELQGVISNSRVVDLSKRKAGTVAATASLTPQHQLQHSRNMLLAYRATVVAVQSSVEKAVACQRTGGAISTSLRPFPSTQLTKVMQERGNLTQLGQVTVMGGAEQSAPVPVVMTPQHIHCLHTRLLC